jgi:cytochrome c2
MWKALGRNATRPQMSSMETADLFAYFYSMFYFTIPGDAARGKVVFEEKNCAGCHTTQSSGSQARPISRWSKVKDPIVWAERMWNHSREMHREMTRKGLSWPKMSGQNMVDLLVYVRSLPAARSQEAAFEPGEPPLGRVVFERNCERCHTFGSKQYGKIDLVERPGPRSLTDYIASMWNHAPLMRTMAGPNFVPLSPGDMTNLVAYLYAERYFFEKGSEDRGASVYREKGCATCHEQRRGTTNAPDLTQVSELFTPVTMAAAVWRHGPSMLEVMNRERIQWPEFHGSEMSNIIAYLNSRVVPRMAPVKP